MMDALNIRRPAVFLDRDGVINEIIYNEDTEQMDSPFCTEQFDLIAGVKEAVNNLKGLGFYIFVVTNQPAAAKGKTTVRKIEEVNNYMCQLLDNMIDKVYTCYHFPKSTKYTKKKDLIQECNCRKPAPGLLLQAMKDYDVDREKSYMVGDSWTDVVAGFAAGVRTAFVGSYKCDVCKRLERKPDIIVPDLLSFSIRLREYMEEIHK